MSAVSRQKTWDPITAGVRRSAAQTRVFPTLRMYAEKDEKEMEFERRTTKKPRVYSTIKKTKKTNENRINNEKKEKCTREDT